ncbi:MAG TPA: hypothetical protein VL974_11075 [Magnetospirillum sp.]|nr:hypothetical protein [Magnetospirillum sp.]
MITTAPLPPLSALLGLGSGRSQPLAPWLRAGEQGWMLSRSCWSLALMAERAAARLGRPPRVALPAWFCAASLVPLRRLGAELAFLPVDTAGTADWSRAEGADMVVAVHTFGRRADLSGFRAAAPLAVEDCAHVLVPAPGIGETGDAVLYSPHKLLGLPEGAVLVLRDGTLSGDLARKLAALPPAPASCSWRIKRLIQTLLPDRLRTRLPPVGQPSHDADPALGEPAPLCAPSPLAAHLLASADLEREAARRRANALALRRAVAEVPGVRPFFREDGHAPYRFVLKAADALRAAALYHRLRQARLPVETWPDVVPEVAAEPDRYGAAMELRRTILLLPVHGALSPVFAHRYAEAFHGA